MGGEPKQYPRIQVVPKKEISPTSTVLVEFKPSMLIGSLVCLHGKDVSNALNHERSIPYLLNCQRRCPQGLPKMSPPPLFLNASPQKYLKPVPRPKLFFFRMHHPARNGYAIQNAGNASVLHLCGGVIRYSRYM